MLVAWFSITGARAQDVNAIIPNTPSEDMLYTSKLKTKSKEIRISLNFS
jgi:hypothetical protein